MDESILDCIPRLKRSVRFWRATSLILATILLSVGITGLTLFVVARQHALRAMEAEMVARDQAEALRMQAERALQAAKQKQGNN